MGGNEGIYYAESPLGSNRNKIFWLPLLDWKFGVLI
jgi:hypothetical protein